MANKSSASMSPEFVLYRTVAGADDSGTFSAKSQGINMADFAEAIVQVIPSAGIDPDATVYFWSEEAAKFIKANPDIVFSGIGAGEPYQFTVAVKGRIMFVAVAGTLGVGDSAKVMVAGWRG